MTEAEYLVCDDPAEMLATVMDRTASGRERITNRITDAQLRRWVEACREVAGEYLGWQHDLNTAKGLQDAVLCWAENVSNLGFPYETRAAILRDIVNPWHSVVLPTTTEAAALASRADGKSAQPPASP